MATLLHFVLDPRKVQALGPRHEREVKKLTLKNTEYLFGHTPVSTHLEKSCVTLGAYNAEEDLCGVISVYNYPNVPAVPPWEWMHWLYNHYELHVEQIATLWIHYSVWDRRYTTLFIRTLLQSLFEEHEVVEQVMYVCPPGIQRLEFIEEVATRVLPVGFTSPAKVPTVYILKRATFVAQYIIRRAVEEDNDDVVAIIPKEVEDIYGHYYISELLSNPDQAMRQVIVAEHRGCAVSVACLNETVNYDLLNEEFELVPYHGLKKPDSEDEIFLPHVPSPPNLSVYMDIERLPKHEVDMANEEVASSVSQEQEQLSEDDFSILNLSSSLILNYLFEEELPADVAITEKDSRNSIESHFSAVVLNEIYQDHLYNVSDKVNLSGDREISLHEGPLKPVQEVSSTPMYYGEPNAFTMEICSSKIGHESSLYLLFQAAFECFPDREYCVVSFPSSSINQYLMRHFARVVPRANSTFHYELYVLHKNSVLGNLTVRVAVPEDTPKIVSMITSMIKPTVIEDQFRDAVENPSGQGKGYVFLCEEQIVGCAVVSEEHENEYLELNYNLETWTCPRSALVGDRGCLDEFLVSPIFQRQVNFFLSELHRLSDFRIMFYRLKRYDYMYTHRTLPIVNSLASLAPVLPNPLPEYEPNILEEYRMPLALTRKHQPFALYISTLRLCNTPRVEINDKVVVIGAGFTSLAFLDSLLFGRNPTALVTFTNVSVISPHGISYQKAPSLVRTMVFVDNGHVDFRYIDSVCFRTYVHVVTGVMTSINRREKYVALNDDLFLPYDYLFLMCGEQFQMPPNNKPPDPPGKEEDGKEQKRGEFPSNVFILNTEADAATAFNTLKTMATNQKQGTGKVLVYGHYLEACCCLGALLEFGMDGADLIYVDPSPDNRNLNNRRHDHLTQYFNNVDVETAVLDSILSCGITIYQDYNFVDWCTDTSKNIIESVKFVSKYKFIEMEVMAMFIYHSKGISTRTFQAIVKSGLVFNGRLVINKDFETNDPYIYAAGPCTMYSKKYHAEHLMHKYFNGEETGFLVGQTFRRKLVPREHWDIPRRPNLRRKPLVQHCQFPGNLTYLHVSKPGKLVPLDVAINKSTYGKVLITGDCKNLTKQGYFRLHLNQYNTIETITCLAKFPIPVHNLISLWGKHEAIFNNLLLRYQMRLIPDLFEFFRQPWTCAIYHMSFNKLMDEIDQEFIMTQLEDGRLLVQDVENMLIKNEWNSLSKLQNDEIEELCRDCGFVNLIEKKVLDFLNDHYHYLPMYIHHMFIRWVMHQVEKSPLFFKTVLLLDQGDKPAATIPFFRTKGKK